MAIKKDHKITVVYKAGLYSSVNALRDILTKEDFALLEEEINRDFLVKDAYHRVEQIQSTKERMDFTLAIYTSDVSKVIARKKYNFVPDTSEDAVNYHTQCYEYIKTLKEFAGAEDC